MILRLNTACRRNSGRTILYCEPSSLDGINSTNPKQFVTLEEVVWLGECIMSRFTYEAIRFTLYLSQ